MDLRVKLSIMVSCLFLALFDFGVQGLSALDQAEAVTEFKEIWAYVVNTDPNAYDPKLPITDLAYFCVGLNSRAKLGSLPDFSAVKQSKVRRHLVIAETGNYSVIHFALSPEFPMRSQLLDDLEKAALLFDGIQIDFETVLRADKEIFLSFLQDLKRRLPNKIVSVALPARQSKTDEFFDYSQIAQVVDRIIVMAYDQHWSGSSPGPIASLDWGAKVAEFTIKSIGLNKAVMGVPFYGRVWADQSLAKAYGFAKLSELVGRFKAIVRQDVNGVPSFTFSETIRYTAYFEDKKSLQLKMLLYKQMRFSMVGFWRLGLEDTSFWQLVKTPTQ